MESQEIINERKAKIEAEKVMREIDSKIKICLGIKL